MSYFRIGILLFSIFIASISGQAQVCTTIGQNPSTAFPVCGTDTFTQKVVPICGIRKMPTPCNDLAQYEDKNPYWYKFTCFAAGTLGFVITPFNLNDDYDWQLFDITGRNPDDVYTDKSLFVSTNWSSRPGATGTRGTSGSAVACAGPTYANFNPMPNMILGHEYLLLVSHFTDSQEGYFLSFGGGTGSIVDPKLPKLATVTTSCDGTSLTLKTNKKMKCNSLAANGSDFVLSPAGTAITSAVGIGCSTGFDTDSIAITLAAPLPSNAYFLIAKNGADGNTLLDNCNRNIPIGDQVAFNYIVPAPIRADSISKVGCQPSQLLVYFPKKISCSSISAAGTDFRITGTSTVNIASASGVQCQADGSNIVMLTFASPIYRSGTFTLSIDPSLDGSPIFDVCGQPILAQTFNFTTADTVSAVFSSSLQLGCKVDTISYVHDGRNGVNSWKWLFDNGQKSNLPAQQVYYKVSGSKQAELIVSNGVCADTATNTVVVPEFLKAAFQSTDYICPKDTTTFKDISVGKIINWRWSFSNGNTSNAQNPPPQFYPLIDVIKTYPIQLIVTDVVGCSDTLTKQITAVANCYIAVPSGFTPNGDGRNDFLYPINAYKADGLEFKVYNRFGQLVWQTTDWTRKWDGTSGGKQLTTQAFVWTLNYTNRDTGKAIKLRGTTVLIR
jgi:gliding motility-associated-like protein